MKFLIKLAQSKTLKFIFLISLVLLQSCQDSSRKIQKNNIHEYRSYIDRVPPGVVSIHNAIQIGLKKEITKWDVNQKIDSKI